MFSSDDAFVPSPAGPGSLSNPTFPELPFSVATERFLARTRHTRTGSRHTARAYRTDLRHYGAFLSEAIGCADQYLGVRRATAERYLVTLSAEAAPRTIRRRVSCVRRFYRFLQQLELVDVNPFAALDLPSYDRKSETHRVWSDPETERAIVLLRAELAAAQRAFAAAEPGRDRVRAWGAVFQAARRRAMFVLLVESGLRCAELVHLETTAVTSDAGGYTLRIVGKGSKTRLVPLARTTLTALSDWMRTRRHLPGCSPNLFVTDTGRPVTTQQVYRLCQYLDRRVQAQHRLHPHMLRRSAASRLLRATGNLRAVQELLGHATVATTEVYTHVDAEALRRTLDAAPIAARDHALGPVLTD